MTKQRVGLVKVTFLLAAYLSIAAAERTLIMQQGAGLIIRVVQGIPADNIVPVSLVRHENEE